MSEFQLVATAPTPPAGADAPDINFRAAFGLTTDTAYIDQLKNAALGGTPTNGLVPAPTPPGGHPKYGVVLSAAEQAELDYRADTLVPAERTPELTSYLAAHADTFGGMYLDHQAGGKVTLLFTSGVAARLADLTPIFAGPTDRLVVRQVTSTETALAAAQQRLNADFSYLFSLGLDQTSVDTIHNVVVVSGPGANSSTVAALQNHFGDLGVTVWVQPAPSHLNTGNTAKLPLPFESGESITPNNPGGFTPVCTLGFLVQRGRQYFATTAGHCAQDAVMYRQDAGDYTGNTLGTVKQNPLIDGCVPSLPCYTNADAELVDVGASRVSNIQITTPSQIPYTQPITSAQGHDADNIGNPVCMSGRNTVGTPDGPATTYVCGAIVSKTVTWYEQNYGLSQVVQYVRQISCFHPLGGDSGAPYMSDSQAGEAVGSNVGSCNYLPPPQGYGPNCDGGYYSQIWDVQNQLNVTVVTTPGPGYLTPNAEAAVVGGLSNSLGVYVDAVDGTVQRGTIGYQSPPASETWETLPHVGPTGSGVIAAGNPAAVSDVSTPRQDVFVRGSDGHLYHNWNPSGAVGGWGASGSSGWEQLPGPTVISNPTVENEGLSGIMDVFATASDGYLYQWSQNESVGGWGRHEYYNGAPIQGNPVAQSWPTGGFHVFWRGTDNWLWNAGTWTTGYPAASMTSGFVGGDPAPILNPGGNWENIFSRGSNGTLHIESCCTGGWTTSDLGDQVDPNMGITASGWGSSIISWFAGGNGNVQAVSCCSPGWSAPYDSGQPTGRSSTPVGVYWTNHYDVFYRNLNNDNWVSDLTCCPGSNWSPLVVGPGFADPRW